MPLQSQIKSIPLYGGLDTKTDPKYVAWDKSLTAQNVQYFGVRRCRKRYGQTALSSAIGRSGGTISVGKAIGRFQDELLLYDGSQVYAYAESQENWYSRAALTESVVNRTPIVRTSGSVSGIATAVANSIEVYAWEDSRGGIYYALRDPESGTFAVPNSQLDATGVNPQIVVSGVFVYIVYGTPGLIKAAQISSTNPTGGVINTYTLTNDYATGKNFAVTSTTSTVALAWPAAVAGTWNSAIFDSQLNLQLLNSVAYSEPASYRAQLAYSTDGSRLLLSVAGTNVLDLYPIVVASAAFGTISTTAVPNIRYAAAVGVGLTSTQLFYDTGTTTSMPITTSRVVSFATASTLSLGTAYTVSGVQLASQPVLFNAVAYIVAVSPLIALTGAASQQPSFYLLRAPQNETPTIIQRFSGDLAYVAGQSVPVPSVVNDQIFLGLAERTALRADATGTVFTQAGLTATYFSFPDASSFKVTSFGSTAQINCGNVYSYDGSQVVESGFWEFPDGITATPSGGAGLNQGRYIYQITYEWVDAAGNTHYSAPSWPIVVTTTNPGQTNQVSLTIPYTALTRKQGATVNVYRTATAPGDPSGIETGLGNLYKIHSETNDPGLSGTASFTWVDTVADASAVGQEILYAPYNGFGELENNAPPPFLFMVATKTRVFGIAQDDRTALWYSKPLAPGRPVQFNSAQIIRIETDGGPVTALGYLDAQAVVFKQRRTYFLPGDGPNAGGGGTQFPPLQLIASTSGCTSDPSVLSTHEGVFFKSEIGIQVLNRSLTMDANVGLPVQGYTSLTLTGTAVVPDQNQLRWVSSDGTALVYDYVVQRWAVYTNYASVGYTDWNNTTVRLLANGQLFYEDQSVYTDNGAPITMMLETAWLKPADIAQGFAAVWYAEILGEYKSPHQLQVEVAYDYIDAPMQVNVWNVNTSINTSTYGSASPYGDEVLYGSNTYITTAPYQLRVALRRQVCEAVKFRIFDVAQTGQSCDLNEIALQLGVIGGLNRVPTRQQV